MEIKHMVIQITIYMLPNTLFRVKKILFLQICQVLFILKNEFLVILANE